jgi:hypothetical protein
MTATVIGRVRSGNGKSYEVTWDAASRDVCVSYAGWTRVGPSSLTADAMRRAEAWLCDK